MRQLAEVARIREFMRRLGASARQDARVYFTGGVSAVLIGWRSTTIDIDLCIVPERDDLLRAVPELKESLNINVELAAPSHFLPELPGWQERSPFIDREGLVSFHHYDFYSQALAKIERAHSQDTSDVLAMFAAGLVEPDRLRELFAQIEGEFFRYPALDPKSFRRAVDAALVGR